MGKSREPRRKMARKRLEGVVISDKMEKTVVVTVERVFAHPVYKKRVKVLKRYLVHDELGVKVGDKVVIEGTRPISRRKRWRVVATTEARKGIESTEEGKKSDVRDTERKGGTKR